ncbi:MAG: preprotein translocase subunit SecE [Verrucomicrobia bacterium]|nr:preprotein translocase subunit SecE [Verrucomicrobiota bacterium]
MNFYIKLAIWVAVIGVTFGVLWHKGYLARFAAYIAETREELKKCTWPTWDELKGNTAVVMVSILLLGAFTVSVDFLLMLVVKTLAQ